VRRRLIAFGTLLLGCASAAPPPGGPEDKAPPLLVRVTPDTNAVNVGGKAVSFYFDETINDRGTGAQEVGQFFLVSPSDGEANVSWHRSRIDVSPRHGFRRNTAYTVTLLPGLADLRGNIMKGGAAVTFSTGPTIPTLRIRGTVFDWIAERVATKAYVEAISADSVRYLAESDTLGRFSIGPLEPGSYLVRAIIDQNRNRALDRNEAYDSVRVTAPQSALLELLAVARDTLPARLQSVSATDSITLKVTFDRPVDPTQQVPSTFYRLVSADITVIPIVSVRSPIQEAETARNSQRATADSVRRADSLAGRAISPVAPAAPPRAAVTPPLRGGAAPAAEPAKPSLPAPYTTVTVRLERPLAPNARYRLSVTGIRSLSGRSQPSEVGFSTPKPAPPPTRDSTRSAPGAARVPAVTPPGTPPAATPTPTVPPVRPSANPPSRR
jgi:hypothetical protein